VEYKYPYYSLNQPIVLGSNEFCKFTLRVYYITLHMCVFTRFCAVKIRRLIRLSKKNRHVKT